MEDSGEAKAPRAGRRARQAQMMQEEQVVGGVVGDERTSDSRGTPTHSRPADPTQLPTSTGAEGAEEAGAPAAPRRQGFADMGSTGGPTSTSGPPPATDPLAASAPDSSKNFTGVSRRKQEQEAAQQEEVARARNKYEERAGPDGAMQDIPELEEEGKEDISRVVASAPRVRANKIQGMEELDGDAQYHLPVQQNRDIDLSILTAVLLASDMVYEPDEVWNHELLLSQVAAEMNADKDRGAEPEAKISDPNLLMV